MTAVPPTLSLTVVDAGELAEVKAMLRQVLAALSDRADAPAAGETMSVSDAAAMLSLSQHHVRRLVDAGEVAASKLGRRVVVSRRSCREYLERHLITHGG